MATAETVLLWALAIVLIVAGFAGIVLPAVPGTVLIFLGLLVGAWADGFERVGAGTLIVVGIIGAASYFVDLVSSAAGARRMGASGRAVAGAALGTLLGVFFGLPGLILGPLVGAILGELSVHRDLVRVGRAGVAAWIGFVVGTAVKIALAFSMVAIFLTALFVF